MSYVNRESGGGRTATIAAVAGLHVAAIWALINGLGIDYVKEKVFNLPTRNIEAPPPEPEPLPEPPPARPETVTDRVDVVTPVIPEVPRPGDIIVDLPPIQTWEPTETVRPADPPPLFKPVSARPLGKPGLWVTPNDYPTRDIRQGNEGRAQFVLAIDANGKVTGCRITQSSGHQGLDQATCLHVSRRATFDPARNDRGERVAGSYAGTIRWVIPR